MLCIFVVMENKISDHQAGMTIDRLSQQIVQVQDVMQAQAAHAVNLSLTARNWLIGHYIVEYEQHGEDRAQYGAQLLNKLAAKINRRGLNARRLRECRLFYCCYPQLGTEVITFVGKLLRENQITSIPEIWRSAPAKLQIAENQNDEIWRSAPAKLEQYQTPPSRLFQRLNFTSLLYLSSIEDDLKRAFYEQEAIAGCWTTRELDRQVSSLYFERMGLSKDKLALRQYVEAGADTLQPQHAIHDPVTLEFLGLQHQDIFTESRLENEILNHLQHFLLEMGKGFCFEARQRRILVDQDYFKADLIFYHRILKCHLIVDLKIDRFRHEYASQLNLYLNYYRHEVMQPDDNPPIGLLLCTDYGETTVKYATEGLSQNLFVSKYRLQLPSEDEIRNYLMENIDRNDFLDKEK